MIVLTKKRGPAMRKNLYDKLRNGLIVSCQALSEEPLYSPYIMSRMAYAAKEGGAVGIRANTAADIRAIKHEVDLPIIGIVKREYAGSEVYITPTMKEVDELVACEAEIIAVDATNRLRPGGRTLSKFWKEVKEKYPDQLFMADCASYEEGMNAASLEFDFIGTTMSGYTEETKDVTLPNHELMRRLSMDSPKPVIAEGGIWTPEQLKEAFSLGVFAAVIGSAITRPKDITKHFISGSGCRSGNEMR
jgi:N-acylglucosamine-6-phosphate 2-epimerase